MSDKTTSVVGLRLTERHKKALERYAAQVEGELQKTVPSVSFSPSAAARAIIEKFLEVEGLLEAEKPTTQAKPNDKEPSKKQQVIEALKAGYSGTGAALAKEIGCDAGLVSRTKKQLREAGEI